MGSIVFPLKAGHSVARTPQRQITASFCVELSLEYTFSLTTADRGYRWITSRWKCNYCCWLNMEHQAALLCIRTDMTGLFLISCPIKAAIWDNMDTQTEWRRTWITLHSCRLTVEGTTADLCEYDQVKPFTYEAKIRIKVSRKQLKKHMKKL